MTSPKTSEKLAEISVPFGRRMIGVIMLVGLGSLLVYAGAGAPNAALGPMFILMLAGGFSIFIGYRLYQATAHQIYLSEDALWCSDGTHICDVADIEALNRGVFAMKPSNGFTIVLKTKASALFYPGLFWRVGRRIGVGGVVRGAEAKPMAEMIETMMHAAR
ncbi:MAG: hypothetical protein ACPGVK_07070 [Halocynthiibacter sp.]